MHWTAGHRRGLPLMPLSRTYPDYGSPGAPNTDPYYLSPAEERELEAEREAEIAHIVEGAQDDIRAILVDAQTMLAKAHSGIAEVAVSVPALGVSVRAK